MGHQPDDLTKLIARVVNLSGSRYVNIPRPIIHRMCWNDGDVVKVEIQGDSLVLTRVPLEQLGKARLTREAAGAAAPTTANATHSE